MSHNGKNSKPGPPWICGCIPWAVSNRLLIQQKTRGRHVFSSMLDIPTAWNPLHPWLHNQALKFQPSSPPLSSRITYPELMNGDAEHMTPSTTHSVPVRRHNIYWYLQIICLHNIFIYIRKIRTKCLNEIDYMLFEDWVHISSTFACSASSRVNGTW